MQNKLNEELDKSLDEMRSNFQKSLAVFQESTKEIESNLKRTTDILDEMVESIREDNEHFDSLERENK